ncbi:MAG: hypothetical protein HYV34_02210, partial [Candidatus Kerfeldbacteria bacterium]|nr:hypothetical protein [Candidatus Kerfeldbacteria bacterium]
MKSTVNITLWIVAAVLIAGASFGLGYVFGGDKIAGEKKNANTTNTASTTASPTNEGQVDATVKQYSGVYSFSATVREVNGTRLT